MTQYFDLAQSAAEEMQRDGFSLQQPSGEREQLAAIVAAGPVLPQGGVDLRSMQWSSIDNDTSRDLDQIEVAERLPDGGIRVLIGIADVSASVAKDTPIDRFASSQTQTVYTGLRNFPMLPNELSTGLTSLNENEDRAAIVAEFTVAEDGSLGNKKLYAALVRNQAQLAYSRVGPWLEGQEAEDHFSLRLSALPWLQDQLKLQDEAATRLRAARDRAGALDFRRQEAQPIIADGHVQGLNSSSHNRAMNLIEDLMIAANETAAELLHAGGRSSIRRIVRTPKNWQSIVTLASKYGTNLPNDPDSHALNDFLCKRRESDPDHYPDLALAVIKLIGAGEYVVSPATDPYPPHHFALAAQDYSHSTAPNRRFPDLVTQRLIKAMLANQPAPYSDAELSQIAEHQNDRDKAARKVERSMLKRVSAVAMANRIGQIFTGVITGAGPKGVFVRVFKPPVEGKVMQGEQGLHVGDKVQVKLVHTDPTRAFIDFVRA